MAVILVALAVLSFMGAFGLSLWQDLPAPALVLHATLMVAAWGVLLPAGAVVARYYKVTRGQDYPAVLDNPFWWKWHRILQYAGLTCATLGFAAVLSETRDGFETWHGRFGSLVLLIGWGQLLSTWFRGNKGGPTDEGASASDPATWRGDHYDMTPRRRAFEAWHKTAGWLVLTLAAATMLLGVALVGAPDWLVATSAALQTCAVLAIVDGRLRGRWIDTYHALWGPDPRHPGNTP